MTARPARTRTIAVLLLVAVGLLGWVPAAGAADSPWSAGVHQRWEGWVAEPFPDVTATTLDDPAIVVGVATDQHGSAVTALAASTGRRRWRTVLPTPRDRSPDGSSSLTLVAAQGRVALAGRSGLRMLDASDGRVLWSVRPSAAETLIPRSPSVLVSGDAVYYRSREADRDVLSRLDARTGRTVWTRPMRGSIAVGDGVLVVGDRCGAIGLDEADGTTSWTADAGRDDCEAFGGDPAAPVVGNGLVVDQASAAPTLRDVRTGAPRATLDAGGRAQDVVGFYDGTWVTEGADFLAAFDATGARRWTVDLPTHGVRSTEVHGDVVATAEGRYREFIDRPEPGTIEIFDVATGEKRASWTSLRNQPGTIARGSGPLVVDDALGDVRVLEPGPPGAWFQRAGAAGSDAEMVDGNGGSTSAQALRLDIAEGSAPGTTCRVDDDAWSVCAGTWTTPALADGERSIEVRTPDGAVSRRVVTVDRRAPEVRITSGPDRVLNAEDGDGTVEFEADEPVVSWRCRVGDGEWTDEGDARTCADPRRATGEHEVSVMAVDAAGNRSAVARRAWREDRDPPSVALRSPETLIDDHAADLEFDGRTARGRSKLGARSRVRVRTPLCGARCSRTASRPSRSASTRRVGTRSPSRRRTTPATCLAASARSGS